LAPWDAQGGPPVVLVHGYLMNRACMLGLYWRLRRRGMRNLYLIDLRPTWGSIETVGARTAVKLRLISKGCGGAPLVAVCHSMGGLVMRWCAQNDPTLPLAKIICLASPHQGTLVAALAVGANGVQLRQGSPLIASLLPSGVPVVSIYSDLDNMVLPAASAAFGERTIRFEHCGHATILYDARVFEAVWDEMLRLQPPTAMSSLEKCDIGSDKESGKDASAQKVR
jgi:triacylglycerol lipase